MRIVFWGSDDFAITTLEAVSREHNLDVLICQPDQPAGRHKKYQPPPTKVWAEQNGITVFQPSSLSSSSGEGQEFYQEITRNSWDLFLVISYGKILPVRYLHLAHFGAINVHASLLPQLRGASPIESALWRGFESTGITIQRMVASMDAGPILEQKELNIKEGWDAGDLREQLSILSAEMLPPFLDKLAAGRVQEQEQDDSAATYCGKLIKEDLWLDWKRSAWEIYRQVLALSPKYGARTLWQGQTLKIFAAEVVDSETPQGAPGEIVLLGKGEIIVATAQGHLRLGALQPQSKKRMGAQDFVNGARLAVGMRFGE